MTKITNIKPKCLIVEDDEDCRWIIMRALMRLEFECETANDGRHALEIMKRGDYQVVVTDLKMPNKHGFSLATDLKSSENPPAVVVYTGVEEPKLVTQLYTLGVDEVCIKPISPDVLAAKINAVFHRWIENNQKNKPEIKEPVAEEGAKPNVVRKVTRGAGGKKHVKLAVRAS